ncbi:hypothetical protein [Pseudooceanicola sp. MF1-13]|uniref:hypothetical protein n=1 Tax=Pseudooceanicola sp. MF1-13 TaxID=3379095 RepID=UPI0038921204
MGHHIRHITSTIALGLVTALPSSATADVTPADVWAQWAGYLSSFGYTVEVEPETDGTDIRFPKFEMTMFIPSDPDRGIVGGTVVIGMGELALIDQGDGTVSIEMPVASPITVRGDGAGDEDFTATMNLMMEGHRTIASGQPGDITYDYIADRIAISLEEVTSAQGDFPVPGTVSFSMEGASGQTSIAMTDGTSRVDQTMQVARLTYDVELTEIDGDVENRLMWSGEMTDLTTTSMGVVPPEVNPLAIDVALRNGYTVNADAEFGGGSGEFYFADERAEARVQTSSGGGTYHLGMSDEGLSYDLMSRDLNLSVAGNQIPFPVNTSAAALGLGISLPVIAGAEEQPFAASVTITDLAVPEPLWMMADPTNALPHDPITIETSFTGTTRLFVDLMNERAMSQLDRTGGAPGELTSLVLEQLRLRAAGALVEATADFDIDNTKVFPLNPSLPAFDGVADIRMDGVTTLLGKLGQMGLIPMQQVMIGSGMIQQLGRQGPGADEYSATIEVTPQGALSVNGMPLPLQ